MRNNIAIKWKQQERTPITRGVSLKDEVQVDLLFFKLILTGKRSHGGHFVYKQVLEL